jgi:hypothetical protein
VLRYGAKLEGIYYCAFGKRRGCGKADSFNGIPSECIEATMWIEYLLGLAAGRMGDPHRLGSVGDGQNRARNGSGTARADWYIGMPECSHEPTEGRLSSPSSQ